MTSFEPSSERPREPIEAAPLTGEVFLTRVSELLDQKDELALMVATAKEAQKNARAVLETRMAKLANSRVSEGDGWMFFDGQIDDSGDEYGRASAAVLYYEGLYREYRYRSQEELAATLRGRHIKATYIGPGTVGFGYFTGHSTYSTQVREIERGVGGDVNSYLDSFLLRVPSTQNSHGDDVTNEYEVNFFQLDRDEDGKRRPAVELEFLD